MAENGSPTSYIYSYSASELESLLKLIRQMKMSGSVTINFSQGSPSGTIEWREKIRAITPNQQSLSNLVREK